MSATTSEPRGEAPAIEAAGGSRDAWKFYMLHPLQRVIILDSDRHPELSIYPVGRLAVQLAAIAGVPLALALALAHDDFAAHVSELVAVQGAVKHLDLRSQDGPLWELHAWLSTPTAWANVISVLYCAAAALIALHLARPPVRRVALVAAEAAVLLCAIWAAVGWELAAVAVLRQTFLILPVAAGEAGLTLRQILSLVFLVLLPVFMVLHAALHAPQGKFISSVLNAEFKTSFKEMMPLPLRGVWNMHWFSPLVGGYYIDWVGNFAELYLVTNMLASLVRAPLPTAGAALALGSAAVAAYVVCSALLPANGVVGALVLVHEDDSAVSDAGGSSTTMPLVALLASHTMRVCGEPRDGGVRACGAALLTRMVRHDKLLTAGFIASRYNMDTLELAALLAFEELGDISSRLPQMSIHISNMRQHCQKLRPLFAGGAVVGVVAGLLPVRLFLPVLFASLLQPSLIVGAWFLLKPCLVAPLTML